MSNQMRMRALKLAGSLRPHLLVFTGGTLTSGTGRFRGATATAVSSAVSDADNSSTIKVRLKPRG